MKRNIYEKPLICVVEVESNGLLNENMSVGGTTDSAMIKGRDNTISDDEGSNFFGGMNIFDSKESETIMAEPVK